MKLKDKIGNIVGLKLQKDKSGKIFLLYANYILDWFRVLVIFYSLKTIHLPE